MIPTEAIKPHSYMENALCVCVYGKFKLLLEIGNNWQIEHAGAVK